MIKLITIPFQNEIDGFDDQKLNDFLKDKKVASIKEYFFRESGRCYFTFVVDYEAKEIQDASKSPIKKFDESWRNILSEEDMGVFNVLKDWRRRVCEKEGIPPYIAFTNNQLAMIVKKRPQTLDALSEIAGVGKAKIAKYGKDILSMMKI